MTLLTAGYWPTTYWAENYWMQDYWPEYGEAAPPVGSGGLLDPYWRKKKKNEQEELFMMVKELLEAFV